MKDLMKPRYLVIADYPKNPFKVGEILIVFATVKECEEYKGAHTAILDDANNLHKYPAIFKSLQWYEKRELGAMPMYVKDIMVGKTVIKVHEYLQDNLSGFFVSEANKESKWCSSLHLFAPATESEYQNFLTTKTTTP